MSTIIQTKCTVIRNACGPCHDCSEFVPEDMHVTENQDDGALALRCQDCCPVCSHKGAA
jgi:hypothetical protein